MATVVRINDPEVRSALHFAGQHEMSYAEPMPVEEWSGTKKTIGLVILPASERDQTPTLSFVCLAAKGKQIADRFAKGTFTQIAEIDPIRLTTWLDEMPSQFRSHLEHAIAITGRPISPGTWIHARAALLKLRPGLDEHLTALEKFLEPRLDISVREQEIMQEEKDALGVALSVAGIDRSPLAAWHPVESAPFVAGLTQGEIREDVMVIHDATRAPGWAKTDEPYVGVTQFSDHKGNALTVMNVNRHKVEEVTGVDLLYYRHEPASFALVQYKRMVRRTGSDEDASGLEFRPASDGSFEKELERMRTVELYAEPRAPNKAKLAEGQETLPLSDPIANYRLHPRACWIKLCHPEAFKPVESDLVGGMYLPLDFFDQLTASESTLGPKGGRVLTYGNVRRWVNNTLFVELMSGGWIGSKEMHTAWLSKTVEAALSAKRSVVVAEETGKSSRRYRRR
jgi:hypothetical protein